MAHHRLDFLHIFFSMNVLVGLIFHLYFLLHSVALQG
nr:MAG TPA: hypothetical protein [Caudoviricetes sp.]